MNNYGFVRNTDTWGVNSIPFQQYQQAGLHGLAFSADDKNLGQAMKNARAHGMQAAIWLPAGGEGDPVAYARKVKALEKQYGADALIPNIEFTGKGYAGSAGWNWNESMMAELQKLGVPKNLIVAMLPNQDDFNYKAYTSRGASIMPEAFGADTGKDQFDPTAIRNTLLRNGVPENMINVLLSPGQFQHGSGSVFTVDDLRPDQLAAMGGRGGYSYGSGPSAGPAASAARASRPLNPAELRARIAQRVSANIQDRVGGG